MKSSSAKNYIFHRLLSNGIGARVLIIADALVTVQIDISSMEDTAPVHVPKTRRVPKERNSLPIGEIWSATNCYKRQVSAS